MSQCQQCGFVISLHAPCVSVFHQFLCTSNSPVLTIVPFWSCRALQSSARSPQETRCLTKALHGLFISPAHLWFGCRIALSQMRKSMKFVICFQKREKKKREKEGKMCFSDIHTAWSTVLHRPAPRLPSILQGQRVLGNEFLL